MSILVSWVASVGLIIVALLLWLQGSPEAATALFAAIGILLMAVMGIWMATPADKSWLPAVIALGYLAKLLASVARFSVLKFIYDFSGDATRYQGAGERYVQLWRSFESPPLDIGTKAVEATTGFLYIPYVPTMLGGFLLFATIAYLGQILLYAAFRVSAKPESLKWYAAAMFFLPTIVYWPSSIGKESLMFVFIGLAAYGAAALLTNYRLRWAMVFGLGVIGTAAIRPHVALLLVAALSFALLLSKGASARGMLGRKTLIITVVVAFSLLVVVATTLKFGIDLAATGEVRSFLDTVEVRTGQGGSSVAGAAIRSPLDFPAGAIKVLFRPFPQEANNVQALASSAEGMLLLGILAWRFFPMLRNGRRIRREPYLAFGFAFTIGFVIVFSAFNNLGILARQRSQVIPFLVALIIAFGWKRATGDEERSGRSTAEHPAKGSAGLHPS
ncbi:MAG: hypothetical protein ACC652_15705 [Acidimicrobiales bacterium]